MMQIEWMDERASAQDGEDRPDEETERTRALMEKVLTQVLANEEIRSEVMLGVTFVDPDRIRELNRAFRGVDSVTDVLSFPMLEGMLRDKKPEELVGCVDPETGALEIGDLVLCCERAREQAAEYGHSVRREMGYLAAHGLLHLCGYDHETPEEREVMRRKEEAALEACRLTRDD